MASAANPNREYAKRDIFSLSQARAATAQNRFMPAGSLELYPAASLAWKARPVRGVKSYEIPQRSIFDIVGLSRGILLPPQGIPRDIGVADRTATLRKPHRIEILRTVHKDGLCGGCNSGNVARRQIGQPY
ncbi:hypothetical protein GGD83_002605 [Rhodoblastus sphagnicola]|uniref:hypothetical protein n=1 Tax=Rhodoblastus sphagnicola TaxID=333368 RepID=UPI0011B0ED5A|nr:hypothetical protein [Rhodoblastus sphagnicola]MBB4198796.1 hypothetical protein [Rhodoblastus sphagnicola]